MSPIKRAQVVVLLVVVAALLPSTAIAKPWYNPTLKASTRLTPTETSDEPKASGQATVLAEWVYFEFGMGWYVGDVTVTCRGLTPGASYRIIATSDTFGEADIGGFTAGARGGGTANGDVAFWGTLGVTVAREERQPDGSVQLIPVLEGVL